jgi:hypothetical protein
MMRAAHDEKREARSEKRDEKKDLPIASRIGARRFRAWAILSLLSSLVLSLACADSDRGVAPIRLEPLMTLGSEVGDGALATWPRVSARHPLGYRVLVPQPGSVPALPVVYDDSGRFVATLGTRGEGPDNFVEPLFARIGPGDSIWVFDGALRVLVFSPERQFVRSIPLPVSPWDAVVLTGGRIAVTPAVFGEPLPWLLLDGDGTVLRRVGESDPLVPSPRRIVAGRNGTVWTLAMTHRWRMEEWDLEGNRITELTTAPEWFTAHDALTAPGPDRPPQPAVQDGWIDTDGRLWIVGKAPDPNWREGVGPPVDGASPITDADRAYDTMVEVRDGATGALLAEARFDGAYPFIAEAGVLMRVRTTPAGWHVAELARVLVDNGRVDNGQ